MIRLSITSVVVFIASTPLFAQLTPDKALASMKAGDGLQVELFASEPMLINPTSMDIDHLGRVWVAEAVNYRRKNFNRPMLRKEGDRIQVLIDEKGEGKASKAVTFYQGPELYGPLGVCVLPQPSKDGKTTSLRVLVCQSPDILEFTCKDASNPVADGPPKKFLTGFAGYDHDHGVHGITTGPDGKLYFTVGDAGVKKLMSSDGKGKEYSSNSTDCRAGTVWRCDMDGKNLVLIAHNFRNNYEPCVDSFGEIWCSDNDDDGNQQTRICHVMPGGNYGYHPRGAGQSHWHEEQPGIVHKTLRTGFGSPTGICFYEGTLLPKQYQGDLIHCDAGPREVRYFKRKPKGAGYELDKSLMLTSSDNWFRPSDCCVAPDGSVFVADWYDPGVGGHGMGDWTRGRIYRLTPAGHKGYKVPEVKLDTKEELISILNSPCLSTRSLIFPGISSNEDVEGVKKAREMVLALSAKLADAESSQAKARYLWRFMNVWRGEVPESLEKTARDLITGKEDRFNQLAVRAQEIYERKYTAEFYPPDGAKTLSKFEIASLREMIINNRIAPAKDATRLFYDLAKLYDGSDIFYRAALNIALGTDPQRREQILADFDKHFPTLDNKTLDLVWELRPKAYIAKIDTKLYDREILTEDKRRVMEIIASSDDPADGLKLFNYYRNPDSDIFQRRHAYEVFRNGLRSKWTNLKQNKELTEYILKCFKPLLPMQDVVRYYEDRRNAIELASIVQDPKFAYWIRTVALNETDQDRASAIVALSTFKARDEAYALEKIARTDNRVGPLAMQSLGKMNTAESNAVLHKFVEDEKALVFLRIEAVKGLAGSREGTAWLLKSKQDGKFPEVLVSDAGRLLRNSPFQGERNKALQLFPPPGKLDPKKLPEIAVLARRSGNAANGRLLMAKSMTGEMQCMKCHMVRGQGGQIGPDLSMIGRKGSRENLIESILYPSKAIADQYVSWKLDTEDGQSITGLIVQETETTITLRDANGKDYLVPVKGTERRKSLVSLMPEGLIATLNEDELIDLTEYLATLYTPALTPDYWHVAGPFPAPDAAALNKDFGPEKGAFDIAAKFPSAKGDITWKIIKPSGNGYFDLGTYHGNASVDSVSYVTRTIESPGEQNATILLGTDDGCRLFVNGEKVFGHERQEPAAPERDTVNVKLKKGTNTIMLKVNNGNNPHGFYFAITSSQELKLAK